MLAASIVAARLEFAVTTAGHRICASLRYGGQSRRSEQQVPHLEGQQAFENKVFCQNGLRPGADCGLSLVVCVNHRFTKALILKLARGLKKVYFVNHG
jgi:hypothetical protein